MVIMMMNCGKLISTPALLLVAPRANDNDDGDEREISFFLIKRWKCAPFTCRRIEAEGINHGWVAFFKERQKVKSARAAFNK
jgi:hypothetical protein